MEKGFKVVSNMIHYYLSASSPHPVCYQENILTVPHKYCGPLCVFDTKKNAEVFMKSVKLYSSNYCLYECDYVSSPHQKIWCNDSVYVKLEDLPTGTKLASKVIFRKKVSSE